jgi:hypothetical protein
VTVPTTTTMTGILAGTTGPLNIQLVSTLHTGTRVSAKITSGEPFSSPLNVSDVQAGATVDVSLPITCAARTSAAPSDVTTTFTRLDDNSLISNITQRLREQLGERVRVVDLPHAGHFLLLEQPEALARAVSEFLGADNAPG